MTRRSDRLRRAQPRPIDQVAGLGTGPHAELQAHLARFLGTRRSSSNPPLVFTEVALGGSWGSEGRLDVVTFNSRASYTKVSIGGYEVKVSRADLLGDLRAEKWRRYLPWCHRFYFVFPDGLADRDEIPPPAGVIVRLEDGTFRNIRKAATLPGEKVGIDTVARLLWRRDREARS